MTAHGESEAGILRCFGQQVRLLRTSRGLTRAELGAKLGYGEDMVTSVELGRRIPRPEFIDRADEVLGAGGLLVVMKEEVARARYPAFFRDAAKLEAEAVEVHVYANQAVPGLLQVEEYARVVFEMWRPLLVADGVIPHSKHHEMGHGDGGAATAATMGMAAAHRDPHGAGGSRAAR
jgi:transcriptional regulator with XRE-family HTH domain